MHKQQVVAIEFSRRREHEPSALRTFVRLIVLDYKRTRQWRQPNIISHENMRVKEIADENVTKAKATRDIVYTIHMTQIHQIRSK